MLPLAKPFANFVISIIIILSGNLPVTGSRGQGYQNCRRMAINTLIQQLGKKKFDLWGCFVGRADMYTRDGLHLSGKGAAVFADEQSVAVDSGMGSIKISLVADIV